MPTIIFTNVHPIEPTIKKKAMAFLEKLSQNDTTSGLHIEPIQNSADSRVRTGKVDDGYRAVLFKLTGEGSVAYVFYGIWNHDAAIAQAGKVTLTANPINGIPEFNQVDHLDPAPAGSTPATPPALDEPTLLAIHGWTAEDLFAQVGIDPSLAAQAMATRTDDQLMAVADSASAQWQGLALIDLAAGRPLSEVKAALGLDQPVAAAANEDERLLQGMKRPAGRLQFAWIEDSDELRRVVESGDFSAWRVFLHPEQQRYVDQSWGGSARVSGGAGTGKTVVVLHRARRLGKAREDARILVTTFTSNLADALDRDLARLDQTVPRADALGKAGVYVKGIDAVVRAVLTQAGLAAIPSAEKVLGGGVTDLLKRSGPEAWRSAIDSAGASLPDELRSPAFFEAEYAAIVLPNRIRLAEEYFKVRRPGRGVALDRTKRAAVWAVVDAYRARNRVNGTIDFAEAATVAAQWLDDRTGAGEGRFFDHVLVDEAQDLSPGHLQVARALVDVGPDDLFISEDSHQRIYGQKLTLSRFGIKVVGRSRKLTLNYRTTAQNLAWAMTVLDGGSFSDLEGENESHLYRSARSGPRPNLMPNDTLTDELDSAADLIRTWLGAADAPEPETVAILVRDRYQRERVVNGLGERGVEVRAVDREPVRAGRPVVMTMHRAKGTEFSRVLLFGVRDGSIPSSVKEHSYSESDRADALLRERSLLYVAATRARDVLAVSWSGQRSSLLDATGKA